MIRGATLVRNVVSAAGSLLVFGPLLEPDQHLELIALDFVHNAAVDELPTWFLHQGDQGGVAANLDALVAIERAILAVTTLVPHACTVAHGFIVPPGWGLGVLAVPAPLPAEVIQFRYVGLLHHHRS